MWRWQLHLTCVVNNVPRQGLVLVIDNKLIMDHSSFGLCVAWSKHRIKSFITNFFQSQIVIMTFNSFGLSQNELTQQNFVAAFCVDSLGTFLCACCKVKALAKHSNFSFLWVSEAFFWNVYNSRVVGSMKFEITV